jgi:hypothetical protein
VAKIYGIEVEYLFRASVILPKLPDFLDENYNKTSSAGLKYKM